MCLCKFMSLTTEFLCLNTVINRIIKLTTNSFHMFHKPYFNPARCLFIHHGIFYETNTNLKSEGSLLNEDVVLSY